MNLLKSKHKKEMSTANSEASLLVREKDKLIKVTVLNVAITIFDNQLLLTYYVSPQQIREISQHNTELATKLVMENRQLTKEKYEALDQQKIEMTQAARKSMTELRSKLTDRIDQLTSQLKQKDQLLGDMEEMATDVATEFHHLKTKAEKSVSKHKELAMSRKEKLKATTTVNERLRDRMEHEQHCYLQIIRDSHNYIDELQSLLNESTTRCDVMNVACDIAMEDINVRFDETYCYQI